MSRQSKSQWDFGELFPTEATRKVYSVAELTEQVRRLLEKQIGQVWVSGEVTNFRLQSSGHIYFTLKDTNAQIACVLFRGETVPHREYISDGQKILLQGDLTVYGARGQYQLIVRAVELRGLGALQAAFEKLKQKLASEGLFAQERKRPLPPFPRCIGLVTSPTGAAIRDVLHVIRRRNPGLEIVLAACRVQGDGAAKEIANAIQTLNEFSAARDNAETECKLDLILVTRGGGSLEDLWAFNEEVVARAIFESAIPVVSAVGHEIDFTIADFVADLRAATPSAAAEIITEGVFSSCKFVSQCGERMAQLIRRRMTEKLSQLRHQSDRLARAHPRRKLQNWQQRLDDLNSDLSRCLKQRARHSGVLLKHLWERLHRIRPSHFLKQRREQLRQLERRLNALGPEQVLARGYSITTDAGTGKVLRDAKKVKAGQKLKTRLKTGEILSRAESEQPVISRRA
ncbi:MAG TPA: exodeoxyribonuclease VII large subunit [Verrucomicrobiae bacterium]|jgi:exodeoxyribonuclease VII large subunit|nr:exodeoxyribonuclease VII large subunit [Verrucomicrobiae bacterium]